MKLYSPVPHILSAVHRVAKMPNDSGIIDQENDDIVVLRVHTRLFDLHDLS
jgi:hypothetical protein